MKRNSTSITWASDLTPAAWWIGQLADSYDQVSALLPGGYGGYARLLHPARSGADGLALRWSAVAARTGRGVHSQARFPAILSPSWDDNDGAVVAPSEPLPLYEARILCDLLRAETTTPERCWFCRAAGDLKVDTQGVNERLTLPSGGRSYLLHGGSIDLALVSTPLRDQAEDAYIASRDDLTPAELEQELRAWRADRAIDATTADVLYAAPVLWWPEDRAWFVATEPDLASTYIAATREAIDRVRAEPRLETVSAELTDSLLAVV
jgi:hypothetical protein